LNPDLSACKNILKLHFERERQKERARFQYILLDAGDTLFTMYLVLKMKISCTRLLVILIFAKKFSDVRKDDDD
jgi:hypothetical protein